MTLINILNKFLFKRSNTVSGCLLSAPNSKNSKLQTPQTPNSKLKANNGKNGLHIAADNEGWSRPNTGNQSLFPRT